MEESIMVVFFLRQQSRLRNNGGVHEERVIKPIRLHGHKEDYRPTH